MQGSNAKAIACEHVRAGAKPVATAAYWRPCPEEGAEAAGSVTCCERCATLVADFIETLRLREAEAADGDGHELR